MVNKKNIVRIVPKPWGSEEIFARTDKYVGKILYINANSKLSLQYHKVKTETIRVLSGTLHLITSNGQGFQDTYLSEGDTVHITPGMVHRFCADEQPVVLIEVSTPELDDVVRLEDNYGRVEK
jgi:mannose-6-phosphate isomerase-like protein (cupin superfamily)